MRWAEVPYRLLKSSFFLVQSMGGALLLERFWWASSLTCCRDRLSAGMASATKPWMMEKKIRRYRTKMLHIIFFEWLMCCWIFPVRYLRWGVCGRGHKWGVGRGVWWRGTDWQLWVPLCLLGPSAIHLGTQVVISINTHYKYWQTIKCTELYEHFAI